MNSIPPFDHNSVLPPHRGNPALPADISPYACSTIEFCDRFATSAERIRILTNFLAFRTELRNRGMVQNAIQWLDGSFLEDIEQLEGRPPRDLDLVTIYWGYSLPFQQSLVATFPEFASAALSKQNWQLDHYPFDAGTAPLLTVQFSRYWYQLFSHNRNGVWKGMLEIQLDTVADDTTALQNLQNKVI